MLWRQQDRQQSQAKLFPGVASQICLLFDANENTNFFAFLFNLQINYQNLDFYSELKNIQIDKYFYALLFVAQLKWAIFFFGDKTF